MDVNDGLDAAPPQITMDWRYYTGLTLLALSVILPLAALAIVPMLGLSTAVAAGIIGVATVGSPEVLTIAAIAFLGRDTFNYFKYKFLKMLKRKMVTRRVSKARYYFGLALFVGSALPLYLKGFFPDLLPGDEQTKVMIILVSEFIAFASIFILGGEFWEKLKALFLWDAPAASRQQQPVS